MRSQTFLGQAYVARSRNLSDQRLVNMFPEMSEVKTAKDVGMFLGAPGLDLLHTLATSPVRGVYPFNGILYAVAGNTVYSLTTAYVATTLGTIGTGAGPISWIDNGTQVALFDGVAGYLVPGGQPLTAVTIGAGGANYNVGDTVLLVDANGPSPATAQLTIQTVAAGGVATAVSISVAGAFTDVPVLSQASTDGDGSGLTISAQTLGAAVNVYPLTLPFADPTLASYQDGFGVCVQGGTTTIWQSNLFDLSIWDPLNFSDVEARPSNLVAIGSLHRQLFLVQQETAEVWINAGTSGFVFEEEQGVHLEAGCVAPYSLCLAGESLVWLGQNNQGQGIVVQVTGYEPVRISTYAIEYAIQNYATIADAIAYVYQQEGHVFYVLTFPTANVTWVCDLSTQDKPWHQRGYFSGGNLGRHLSNCYAYFNGQCVVGDYNSGNLYAFDLNTLTDNGQPIQRVRSWRALAKPAEEPVRFKYLWLDMMTGVNVAPTANPQVVLQYSDDDGYTWSNELFGAAGKTGDYGTTRVKYNRLGSTGRNKGMDRIWRLSTTDQFAIAWIGAWQG